MTKEMHTFFTYQTDASSFRLQAKNIIMSLSLLEVKMLPRHHLGCKDPWPELEADSTTPSQHRPLAPHCTNSHIDLGETSHQLK